MLWSLPPPASEAAGANGRQRTKTSRLIRRRFNAHICSSANFQISGREISRWEICFLSLRIIFETRLDWDSLTSVVCISWNRLCCHLLLRTFEVPRTCTGLGSQAFTAAGPCLNNLPVYLQDSELTLLEFRWLLKMRLFSWRPWCLVTDFYFLARFINVLTYLRLYV